MSTDLIRYDLRVQEALRGVVRRVLSDAAKHGISGNHHFYISFATQAEGVRLSSRLRQQYPGRMTIVLQHQFWDLNVDEHGFEVGLSFKNVPERLYVPFDALMEFYDPSVQFGLKFENVAEDEAAGDEAAEPEPKQPVASVPSLPKPRLADKRSAEADKTKPRGSGSEPAEIRPRPRAVKTEEKEKEPAPVGEKIVSIDSFRKKT
ncbi:MAG: ClpXP protease specificity-enhancing factor SspB [Beijerinckiaceae bacterium]|jgi:hypothetical protein